MVFLLEDDGGFYLNAVTEVLASPARLPDGRFVLEAMRGDRSHGDPLAHSSNVEEHAVIGLHPLSATPVLGTYAVNGEVQLPADLVVFGRLDDHPVVSAHAFLRLASAHVHHILACGASSFLRRKGSNEPRTV